MPRRGIQGAPLTTRETNPIAFWSGLGVASVLHAALLGLALLPRLEPGHAAVEDVAEIQIELVEVADDAPRTDADQPTDEAPTSEAPTNEPPNGDDTAAAALARN